MERSLSEIIRQEAKNKIILLSGPRQSGKNNLGRSFLQALAAAVSRLALTHVIGNTL